MREVKLSNSGVALVDACDFHWISQRNWYQNAHGYACCDLTGRRGGVKIYMHRLILLAPDTSTVDHANHNTLDNRRCNLRLATQSQQNANRAKITGISQYKGVHRRCDGIKWVAQITPPKSKTIHLGSFQNEVDAAFAYNNAAIRIYGEFACLNQIKETE